MNSLKHAGAGMDRRYFLTASAAIGGGLVVSLATGPLAHVAAATPAAATFQPDASITIGSDGLVSFTLPLVEMGQGTYTSIPMLIAEELEVPLSQVRIVHAPSNPKLFTNPLLGVQATGGSTAVRAAWEPMRKAGASARTMLVAAAARTWNVPPASCRATRATVVHTPTGRVLGYGALAQRAAKEPVPEQVELKAPSQYRLIGTPAKRLDLSGKVNGSAVFGIDVRLPGMKIAAVAACPVFGGKLASVDDTKARAVAGVRQIVKLDDAVAVIADHNGAARKGLAALQIQWDEGANAKFSTEVWAGQLKEASKGRGVSAAKIGNVDAALAAAAVKVQAEYWAPNLAHATLEPMNCTVHWRKTECEVWLGTQALARAQEGVSRVTGLPVDKVIVHNHLIGGGFGRRLDVDYVEQAALIARQVEGPVKVIWSREEDMQHDVYRPFWYDQLSAALDASGKPTAFRHRVIGSSVVARWIPAWMKDGLDPDAVDAAQSPYEFENIDVEYVRHEPPPPLTTGFWRGVGPTHNAFVVEGFIDELANAAKQDPMAFRRALLARQPRVMAVLDQVAQRSGWGTPLPARCGRGVALLAKESWESILAQVVEVQVGNDGLLTIKRITSALDCGQMINPDGVTAQVQGATVFGLTAALYGNITFKDGRVMQSNFHDYQMVRMNQVPPMDISLITNHEKPGGMGEIGTTLVAPALVNAIHAATGVRLRKLPIDTDLLKLT